MKWIFWSLVLFCAVFFGYQQWLKSKGALEAPVVETYQPPKDGVPSLKLVAEVPKQAAPTFQVAAPPAATPSIATQTPAQPAVPVVKTEPVKSEPVAAPVPAQQAALSSPAIKEEPVKQEPQHPAPVKTPSIAAPSPVIPPPAAAIPAPVQAEKTEPQAPAPVVLNLCPAIGPFRSKDSAEPWRSNLTDAHLAAELHEVQLDKNPQHWVVLPVFVSREAAQKKVVELLSKKIDAFVIGEGDMRNAISLGLFDRIESAQAMQQRIKAAGYPAEIKPKPHKQAEWWIKLTQPADPVKIREVLQLKLANSNDEVRVAPSKCGE